jgi:hypothetical protein
MLFHPFSMYEVKRKHHVHVIWSLIYREQETFAVVTASASASAAIAATAPAATSLVALARAVQDTQELFRSGCECQRLGQRSTPRLTPSCRRRRALEALEQASTDATS